MRRWRAVAFALALAPAACRLPFGEPPEPPPDAPRILVAPPIDLAVGPPRDLGVVLSGVTHALLLRGMRPLPLGVGLDLYREHVGSQPVPGSLAMLGSATGVDAVLFVRVESFRADERAAEWELSWSLQSTIDERVLFEQQQRGSWRQPAAPLGPPRRQDGDLEPVVLGAGREAQDLFEALAAVHRGVLAGLPEVPRRREPPP